MRLNGAKRFAERQAKDEPVSHYCEVLVVQTYSSDVLSGVAHTRALNRISTMSTTSRLSYFRLKTWLTNGVDKWKDPHNVCAHQTVAPNVI